MTGDDIPANPSVLTSSPESSSSFAIVQTMRSFSIRQNRRKHTQSGRLSCRSPKSGTNPHFQSRFRVSSYLPFEDQIVYDGWIGGKNIIFGGSLSTDIDDEYEEGEPGVVSTSIY